MIDLTKMEAYPEVIKWHESQHGSDYDRWQRCPRGDWLLWLAGRAGVDRRSMVLAACAIAREVLHLVPADEPRPLYAIEAAEAWARGEVTLAQVGSAAAARARAAADWAPEAAEAASEAIGAAVNASEADAAREAFLEEGARIVREIISWEAVRDGLEHKGYLR